MPATTVSSLSVVSGGEDSEAGSAARAATEEAVDVRGGGAAVVSVPAQAASQHVARMHNQLARQGAVKR
jgi:hypothetical protein